MHNQSSDRAGVLILRLWIEPDHPTALRARITRTSDETRGEQTVAVASSSDEICAIIGAWISAFTAPNQAAGDGPVATPATINPGDEPEDQDPEPRQLS